MTTKIDKNTENAKNVLGWSLKTPLTKLMFWGLSLLCLIILPYFYIILKLKFSINYKDFMNQSLPNDVNLILNSFLLILILFIPIMSRFLTQSNLILTLNKYLRIFILTIFGFMTSYVMVPLFSFVNKTTNFKAVVSGRFNDIIVETKLWSIQKEIDRQTAEQAVDLVIETKVIEFPIKEQSELFKETLVSQKEKLIESFITSASNANELVDDLIAKATKTFSEINQKPQEVNVTAPPNSYSVNTLLWKSWETTKQLTYGTFDLICAHPKFFICLAGLTFGSVYIIWFISSTNASINEDLAISKDITTSTHKTIQTITSHLDTLSQAHGCQAKIISELQNQTLACVEQMKQLHTTQTETNQLMTTSINTIDNNLTDQINLLRTSLNMTIDNTSLNKSNLETVNAELNNLLEKVTTLNLTFRERHNELSKTINTINLNLNLNNSSIADLSTRITNVNTSLNMTTDTMQTFSSAINTVRNNVEKLESVTSTVENLPQQVNTISKHINRVDKLVEDHQNNILLLNNLSRSSNYVVQQLLNINSRLFRALQLTIDNNKIAVTADVTTLIEQSGKMLNDLLNQ